MREIKFRGKRIDSDGKHMSDCAVHNMPAYPNGQCDCGVWAYGYPLCKNYLRTFENHKAQGRSWQTEKDYQIDESTLGEYVGVPDRANNKIYEGDVTKHHSHNTIGVWTFDDGSFVMVEADGTKHYYCHLDTPYLELLGNIHDNPELLEASHE
jgi:hypothetical protein